MNHSRSFFFNIVINKKLYKAHYSRDKLSRITVCGFAMNTKKQGMFSRDYIWKKVTKIKFVKGNFFYLTIDANFGIKGN